MVRKLGLVLSIPLALGGWSLSCSTSSTGEVKTSLITDPITLEVFTRDNQETGAVMIRIPSNQDIESFVTFSVFFDLNRDGHYDPSECGVQGVPAPVEKDLPAGFPVLFDDPACGARLLEMSRKGPIPIRILLEDVPGEGTIIKETVAERLEWEPGCDH